MLKKFEWFIKDYWKSYLFAFIFMFLSIGFELVPPYIIGRTADAINMGNLDLRGLYISIGLLILSIILSYGLTYAYSYLMFRGTDLMGLKTRRRIVDKLLDQGPIFFEKNSTGSLMAKSINDVRSLQDMAGFGMMSMVMTTIYPLIIVLVMAITISLPLTILSVLPIILIVILTKRLSPRLYKAYRKAHESFDYLNDMVLENVDGIRVVRAFKREESEKERFKEKSENFYKANMTQAVYSSAVPPVVKLIPALSYIIAFAYGAHLIGKSALTIGGLIAFISYLALLIRPAATFGEFVNVFQIASASMDRIGEIWSYKEDVVDKKNPIIYEGGGDISFRDFDFKFSDGTYGLKNINLDLKKGQTLGVVGKVGSGKTIFLKQLLRFYPIEEETIFLGAYPIEEYKISSVRDKIAYVPQEHILFSKTIRENICFGRDISQEDFDRAVRLADFQKDLDDMPKGAETEVGERGVSLSGGQKQRLSIARALIRDPEILILDDSLSAVDAKTERNIVGNLVSERKGKTTLISAHRLSGIMHADQIIVLDDGQIVERGNHQELMEMGGWYKDQFEAQRLEEENEEA